MGKCPTGNVAKESWREKCLVCKGFFQGQKVGKKLQAWKAVLNKLFLHQLLGGAESSVPWIKS